MAKLRPTMGRTYLLSTHYMLDSVQERPGNKNTVPTNKQLTVQLSRSDIRKIN